MAHRIRDERAAAMVEFALLLPVFVMLALGILTGAIVVNRKIDLSHAAREGARYGATVALTQCDVPANCGGRTWAQLVRDVAVQRSFNDVTAANVCVALVDGSGSGSVVAPASNYSTSGATCYDDGGADPGKRVQISVSRPGERIEAVFFRIPVTLTSQATSHYEE
jgi:Flp pilus assembly protein TadG